jgi:hypothetical protein
MDWYNNITNTKPQGCVLLGQHSLADTQAGADQIATGLTTMCKKQP